MKISLTRTDIAGVAARKSTAAREPKRLPGETHKFKQLVPPQYLAPDGNVTSSRDHEVSRSDPLMQRIRELEAEVAELRDNNQAAAIKEFLQYWTSDSHLQTFADRERFRTEAHKLL